MPALGTPVFDGLAITDVEINVLGKSMKAKAAFVNTKNGFTHGWTEGAGYIWSPETVEAAAQLIAFMEQDMAKRHFMGQPEATAPADQAAPPASGIAEHLSDDGTKSI